MPFGTSTFNIGNTSDASLMIKEWLSKGQITKEELQKLIV
jgi:uncharacterized membrane protein